MAFIDDLNKISGSNESIICSELKEAIVNAIGFIFEHGFGDETTSSAYESMSNEERTAFLTGTVNPNIPIRVQMAYNMIKFAKFGYQMREHLYTVLFYMLTGQISVQVTSDNYDPNDYASDVIYFITDTGEIYKNGIKYGGSSSGEAIRELMLYSDTIPSELTEMQCTPFVENKTPEYNCSYTALFNNALSKTYSRDAYSDVDTMFVCIFLGQAGNGTVEAGRNVGNVSLEGQLYEDVTYEKLATEEFDDDRLFYYINEYDVYKVIVPKGESFRFTFTASPVTGIGSDAICVWNWAIVKLPAAQANIDVTFKTVSGVSVFSVLLPDNMAFMMESARVWTYDQNDDNLDIKRVTGSTGTPYTDLKLYRGYGGVATFQCNESSYAADPSKVYDKICLVSIETE